MARRAATKPTSPAADEPAGGSAVQADDRSTNASTGSTVASALPAKSTPRTAVLVFHGMGDQRPMETLRGVADAVLGEAGEAGAIRRWVKPYVGKDGAFDLKSISTAAVDDAGRSYDFFELYWADKMSGTRLVAVLLWICDLAKRERSSLPQDGLWIWWFIVGIMCAAMMASLHLFWMAGFALTGTKPADLAARAEELSGLLYWCFIGLGLAAAFFAQKSGQGLMGAIVAFGACYGMGVLASFNGLALLTAVPGVLGLLFFLGPRSALGGIALVVGAVVAIVIALPTLANAVGVPAPLAEVSTWKAFLDIALLTVNYAPASPWLIGYLALFLTFAAIFIVPYLGDCARYLRDAPDNIEARNRIRQLGLEVLEELHRRQSNGVVRYDRIVVVAHSLGSVIAYDVLRAFFVKQTGGMDLKPATVQALRPLDALPDDGLAATTFSLGEVDGGPAWVAHGTPTKPTAAEYQTMVRWAFGTACREQRIDMGEDVPVAPWRISDFITMGSPLTHATLLMTDDGKSTSLENKVELREYPVSPPRRSKDEDGRVLYSRTPARSAVGSDRPLRLQHAGMFALTCWTNLYFAQRFVVFGDFIGGPIHPRLSPGTVNVPLSTKLFGGLFNHVHYWRREEEAGAATPHIRALAFATIARSAAMRQRAAGNAPPGQDGPG
jgi:hypothetical protein